jgi:hypothetical protein
MYRSPSELSRGSRASGDSVLATRLAGVAASVSSMQRTAHHIGRITVRCNAIGASRSGCRGVGKLMRPPAAQQFLALHHRVDLVGDEAVGLPG